MQFRLSVQLGLSPTIDVNTRSVHCIKHFEEYSNEVEVSEWY